MHHLICLFNRISDAPDAIPRLRRFILDLAVRGKLVEQDPRDEPASELLKQIQAEKERLVKAGEIRKQEPAPQVAIRNQPFELPSNWQWVRFGAIADFSAGRTPSRHDVSLWNTGDYPWISIADMKDGEVVTVTKETVSIKAKNQVFSSEPVPVGTMIMSFKLTIGKISRLGAPAFHNEAIISIHPYLQAMDAYLFKVLPEFSRKGDTKDAIKGATLNRDSISNILLPLPPLAEQHCIVAKVDELMALCDRLEAAQTERESRRDRLAASSLHRFNNGENPDAFRDHARFYFNHLPRLTTRSEHIQQLRQTILNLAVRGKLVSQDPNDEPAEKLLIKAEQKKGKWAGPIEEQEVPFQLPSSWIWFRLGDIATLKHGYAFSSAYFTSEPAPFVLTTPGNFYEKGGFRDRESKRKYYSGPVDPDYILKAGDLIIPMTEQAAGLLGSPAFIPDDGRIYVHNQRLGKLGFSELVDPEFAFWFFNSEFFRGELARTCTGMKVRHTSPDRVLRVPFPLPPLAEQHRIVAKVEELMALCDRLDAQLTVTHTESHRLLEAVLNGTLTSMA
ncbi:MAG: hypothetical protein BVN28_06685 [Nitrospira sp. ST-bin4]|nr:MAG: hypothetical protein BVN28_06685 [Nitrospira sp. ST-bin4]